MNMVDSIDMVNKQKMFVQHEHGGQQKRGGQYRHGEYAGNFLFLEVASIQFIIDKVDLVGMVDILDNMVMVESKIKFMCSQKNRPSWL